MRFELLEVGTKSDVFNVRVSPIAPWTHRKLEPEAPCVQVKFEVVRFDVVKVGTVSEVLKARVSPVAP